MRSTSVMDCLISRYITPRKLNGWNICNRKALTITRSPSVSVPSTTPSAARSTISVTPMAMVPACAAFR